MSKKLGLYFVHFVFINLALPIPFTLGASSAGQKLAIQSKNEPKRGMFVLPSLSTNLPMKN
jgi:hypothetical protein